MKPYAKGDILQSVKNRNVTRIITDVSDTHVTIVNRRGTPQRISILTIASKYIVIGNVEDTERNDMVETNEVDIIPTNRQEAVDHPNHYNTHGMECIDWIKHSLTREEYLGFLKGNIEKYLYRYEHKGGVEDLNKASWYLNKLIEENSE